MDADKNYYSELRDVIIDLGNDKYYRRRVSILMNIRQNAHIIMWVGTSAPHEYHVVDTSPSYYATDSIADRNEDIINLNCGATRMVVTGLNNLYKFVIHLFQRDLLQGTTIYKMVDANGNTIESDDELNVINMIRFYSNAHRPDNALYRLNVDYRGLSQSDTFHVPVKEMTKYCSAHALKLKELGKDIGDLNTQEDSPDKLLHLYTLYHLSDTNTPEGQTLDDNIPAGQTTDESVDDNIPVGQTENESVGVESESDSEMELNSEKGEA